MNKLFKSVRSTAEKKDEIIKKSVMTQLSHSVKAIQYSGVVENGPLKEDISESINQLCTVIEAMFLHGLKDSIGRRFKKALVDIDERPEPNFWSPLLVISHRQIIDQILHLSLINTEVGQCRAWVRVTLNDCLLSSYLSSLHRDPGVLKSFYRPTAYLRDVELLDITQRLIEGIEAFKNFTLPCNSSLLNTWQMPSLYLAGIWAATLKSCPVAPCDDVAQMVDEAPTPESTVETASLSSAMSIASLNSGLRPFLVLSEDEALKIILASVDTPKSEESVVSDPVDNSPEMPLGNSLGRKTGWSFDESQPIEIADVPKDLPEIPEPEEPKPMQSYDALIESHNMLRGKFIKTPDFKDVLTKLNRTEISTSSSLNNNKEPEHVDILSKTESAPLASYIGQIANEKGLDSQSYECRSCPAELSPGTKLNVCAYTGEYYCDTCMHKQSISIPARIIHNWDFNVYPVSQNAFNYITEVKTHPVIDLKTLNPYIYGKVEEMSHLQTLRNQLNFLRAYLYTCREPIIEQLQKKMWPREYMYEHIHQYSIADLADLSNGVLAQQLQAVVNFGREHVIGCWLCSQKGFLCEVCQKPKPLFPFDVEHVFRCDVCNAVYHKGCLNSSKPCPKCKRKKEREDLPFLGATIE